MNERNRPGKVIGPLDPVRRSFLALAETFVPEVVRLDPVARNELVESAQSALRTRPRGTQGQVRLFVRLVDFFAWLRFRRRLADLDNRKRTRILEGLQSSRFQTLRRGVWGIRTLVFMGYYTRPDVQRAIGYRANANGWEALR